MSMWWSFLLAGVGVVGLVLAGNRKKLGWMISLCAQVLWFWYALATHQYGFIIACIAYGWVYARNWIAWTADEQVGVK